MTRFYCPLLWILSCLLPVVPLEAASRPGRPVPLLRTQANDGTLAGWNSYCEDPKTSTAHVWKLTADGVLVCKGTPNGYIYTKKGYTDFVLTLEWRTRPGKKAGRGGVLLRMTGKHKIWPKCLEAQLNAGGEGDFWGLGGYALTGPKSRLNTVQHEQLGKLTNLKRTPPALKAPGNLKAPGKWNQYEISARGQTVTLKINGREVNRATRCDVVAGPICLTSEGDEIHFRRVRLIPLRTDTKQRAMSNTNHLLRALATAVDVTPQ